MTWLISKIIGNPTFLIVLVVASFVAGATTGGYTAWTIQGFRLTAEKQKFTGYVQEQTKLRQEAIDHANKQREESAAAYATASRKLQAEIDRHAVYRRCVAAGRCGVRSESSTASINLSPPRLADDSGPDAISLVARGSEELANECAVTTLMLNSLQRDIEKQPGY